MADDRRSPAGAARREEKLVVGGGRYVRGELPTFARVRTEGPEDLPAVVDTEDGPSAAPGAKRRATAGVKGDFSLRWMLILAAFFALTRVIVHLSGSPYFDPDS